MTTTQEIKDGALSLLGINDIDWTNTTDKVVKRVNASYESIVKEALGSYEWFFAISSYQGTGTAITGNRFKYAFTPSSDMIRFLGFYSDIQLHSLIEQDYAVNGNTLLCNLQNPYIKYIARVSDTTFPDYFTYFLKYKIASENCYNLTGDTDLLQFLDGKTKDYFLEARHHDYEVAPADYVNGNSVFIARF